MPASPIEVDAPHTLLRFVEFEDYVYYMDVPLYDRLTVTKLDVEIPIIQAQGLTAGQDGVRCGYRFSCPKALTRLHANYLIVCREQQAEWAPYVGLPGLQTYTSDAGIALISSRVTTFLGSLQQ